MDREIGEGPNCYENQLRAMSMCWSGFDPMGSYGTTPNYSHQSGTCSTLPMTIATQNDQQVIRSNLHLITQRNPLFVDRQTVLFI